MHCINQGCLACLVLYNLLLILTLADLASELEVIPEVIEPQITGVCVDHLLCLRKVNLKECGCYTCMWIKDTWEESMACRAKPVLLQSKLASCTAEMRTSGMCDIAPLPTSMYHDPHANRCTPSSLSARLVWSRIERQGSCSQSFSNPCRHKMTVYQSFSGC